MDLVVIYDPSVEISCLIDTDTLRALGPIGVGPMSQRELSSFVEMMPEAVYNLTPGDLCVAWAQFWESQFKTLHETPVPDSAGPVGASADYRGDEDRAAAREAAATGGDPPAPGPADTDMGADTGETGSVSAPQATDPVPADEADPAAEVLTGECFACHGTGSVPGGTDGPAEVCNLCHGTGQMPEPVAS